MTFSEVLKSNYTFGLKISLYMTLEEVNLMRKANGKEPLTELPADLAGAGGGAPTKTEAEIEAERKAAEEAANKGKGNGDDPTKTKTTLTDEEVLALLAERGISATSLEDLKPKPVIDPAKAAEEREAAELAFGLTKGLFTKKEYDQFNQDTQDVNKLVYDEFYAETKADNPDMKDEDIQAEFLATFGLDKDKDSYQFKRGLKIVKERGQAIMKAKHAKIFSAKDSFGKNEETVQATAETQRKVAAALPTYKKDVKEIVGDLKKISVKMSDDESIELDDIDDLLTGIEDELLNPEFYTKQLSGTYDKEKIKQVVVAGFIAKNFGSLAVKTAKKYFDKHKAGTHGVPAGGTGAGKVVDMTGFTESQKTLIALNQAEAERKAAAKK
jgi:hypothetical protein